MKPVPAFAWSLVILGIACGSGTSGGGGSSGGDPGPGGGGGWTRDAGNPVMSPGPGAWESSALSSPTVAKVGATYHMMYDGFNGVGAFAIGHATSADGRTWTKGTTPALAAAAAWEGTTVGGPTVVHDGTTYRMWYMGRQGTTDRIGLATSADGITWTKSASNPVFGPGAAGSWDAAGVGWPSVIFDGATYRMWYTGRDAAGVTRIGLATSPDGIAWTRAPANPVLNVGPSAWESGGVEGPTVIFDGGNYRMWYGGTQGDDERIGYAESADGIAWSKAGAIDLANGSAGSWEENDVWTPAVLRDGALLTMWYTGDTFAGTSRIGRATKP